MWREKEERRRDKRRQGGRSGDVERERRRKRARETGREGDREEEREEKRAEEQEPLQTNPSTNVHKALSRGWALNMDLQFVFSRMDGPSDLSPGKIYAQLNLAVVNFLFVCFFS